MKIQVLLATMNQESLEILDKMNIQTDIIIANQANNFIYKNLNYKNQYNVEFYSFKERGIGLNRNNALMRSTADICLLADDDMVYVNGYEDIVIEAFKKNPKADVIMFNVPIERKDEKIVKIKKNHKVHLHNCLKYGAVNIAFRRNVIMKKNIYFSLLFGGGSKYGSGEDSIFIKSCLDEGLNIYALDQTIAYINENDSRPSTWFSGYNDKYFFDRGALFAALSKHFWLALIIQFLIRKRNLFNGEITLYDAYKNMYKGALDFKNKRK